MVKSIIKKLLRFSKNENTGVGTFNESSRAEWIEKTLKKIPQGGRILDAGAGEQQFRKYCGHLNYVSQDFAEYKPEESNIALQQEKWDYGKLDIVSDICSMPEPDNSFDAILCTEVFEHIPNPISALDEFGRLLKKRGYLIITAPFCSLTHFAPYHYSTGFNRFFYEKHLPDFGFEIVEIQENGNYFEYIAQELLRLNSVAKRYTNDRLGSAESFFLNKLLKALERFSNNDSGSKELLCFGYHVLARKKII